MVGGSAALDAVAFSNSAPNGKLGCADDVWLLVLRAKRAEGAPFTPPPSKLILLVLLGKVRSPVANMEGPLKSVLASFRDGAHAYCEDYINSASPFPWSSLTFSSSYSSASFVSRVAFPFPVLSSSYIATHHTHLVLHFYIFFSITRYLTITLPKISFCIAISIHPQLCILQYSSLQWLSPAQPPLGLGNRTRHGRRTSLS